MKYIQPLFYALVAFPKKWASIKSDIRIKNKGLAKWPKDFKLKVRECKLRSGVYLQGVLNQKDVKQMGIKQEMGVKAYMNDTTQATCISS
jgi:hypothetical protein